MKLNRYFLSFLTAVAAILVMTSCNKVSHNGALDGQWQVLSIEDTATGDVSAPAKNIFYNFQLHIIQLSGDGGRITGNMSYDKNAGVMTCDFPYIKSEADTQRLGRFGIHSNPVTIEVVKADHSSLVLRTDVSLITCRRF